MMSVLSTPITVIAMLLAQILRGHSHVLATVDTLETVPVVQVRIVLFLDILWNECTFYC